MLDFIYYPVSVILLLFHTVFGALIDPASGIAWDMATTAISRRVTSL